MASKGLELAGLEYMRAVKNREVPPPPIAVMMNMAPTEVGEGRAVFSALPGEEHYNPIGVVHGGFMATLLDSVAGCAVHTTLELHHADLLAVHGAQHLVPTARATAGEPIAEDEECQGNERDTYQEPTTFADLADDCHCLLGIGVQI